jgi:hypothetical protein
MAVDQAGIMALPENQGMQAPQLSMMDSYDAMQQGLKTARPDASMELEEALAEIRPDLDELTDEQLTQLIEAVQGLYGDPENYAKEVADMVKEGLIDAEDLPPEYDEEFLSALLMVLVDAQRSRMATSGSAQPMPAAPMGMAPMGMMPPQGFARGGIAEAAQMVANRGRRGDTMLAHITPSEARMLMARGGSGTINPRTGLPEFFIKKIFKAVGKTFKRVANVVKKVLKSPVGRILGTIALGMVLGPGAFGITGLGLSAGAAGAAASGLITAATGGDLKAILTSAATGFMGAPGGPVSNFIGKYTGQFLTNPVVREAATGAIVGTGTGLVSGQNLKDALKSGLTEGVISGGMAYMSGAPKADIDNAAKNAAADATVQGPRLPELDADSAAAREAFLNPPDVSGAATQRAGPKYVLGPDGATFIDTMTGQPVSPADAARMRLDPSTRKPGLAGQVDIAQGASRNAPLGLEIPSSTTAPSAPGIFAQTPEQLAAPGLAIREQAARAAESGIMDLPSSVAATAAGPYRQPGVMESLGEMGGGAQKFLTGDFSEGASQMYKGASDLFAPGPSAEQRTAMIDDFMAKNPRASVSDAIKYVDELSPGLLRSYGPTTAAGIGALALSGGFTPQQPDAPEQGPTGMDLLQQDPNKYLVQGLPGVQYGAQGNIIGSQAFGPSYSMENIRVPTRYDSQVPMFANGGIAALAQGGYPRRIGQISGPGTEKSDSIPAMLSDGEFVMTAKAVRGAGGGSRRDGAKRMYALMHQLERNAARG